MDIQQFVCSGRGGHGSAVLVCTAADLPAACSSVLDERVPSLCCFPAATCRCQMLSDVVPAAGVQKEELLSLWKKLVQKG